MGQTISHYRVIGGIHAPLGEKEEALAWLRRAVEVGNHNYPWFQEDKNYDKLRGDPEYQRIVEAVKRHWEEYKQKFGGDVITVDFSGVIHFRRGRP